MCFYSLWFKQLGLPCKKNERKSPFMQTVVKKIPTKQGTSSSFYELPRTETISVKRLSDMQSELQSIKISIKFSNCIPSVTNNKTRQNAMYAQFIVGSCLSFHENSFEYTARKKLN